MTATVPASPAARPGPKHVQIREYLEDLLTGLEPGEPLPSERDLAQRFGVARMTVRQAMDRLVRTGQVHRVQGAGSFRARERFDYPVRLASFSEDMRARGLVPGGHTLHQAVEPAPPRVAESLELAEGAEVVRLDRLRTADGEPTALECVHIVAGLAPGLEDVDLEDRSLYRMLRQQYDVSIEVAEQSLVAALCDADEAALLGVDEGAAALLFEHRGATAQGRPVEHTRSLYRGDRYRLRMTVATS